MIIDDFISRGTSKEILEGMARGCWKKIKKTTFAGKCLKLIRKWNSGITFKEAAEELAIVIADEIE